MDAYDEPKKYVVMQDIFSGRAYKQDYKVRSGEYQLVGDRTEVFAQYLTQDEINELDNMRKNYASIEKELNLFKEEPEKIELLSSDDFAGIKATEEYAELSKRENYFELNKADLEEKLNGILLQYAKSNKLNFSANEKTENKNDNKPENKFSMRPLPTFTTTKNRGRYGNLFSSDK